jgi:hypothetical protein
VINPNPCTKPKGDDEVNGKTNKPVLYLCVQNPELFAKKQLRCSPQQR